MAKNTAPEGNNEQKVQTKYDRKMEARRAQKEKEKKQDKLTKLIATLIVAVLVILVVGSVAYSIIKKNTALHGTYIEVGEHKVSQLEYDYYYQSTVSSYMMSYGSILPYMGLDTSVPYDQQMYTEELTWKDMFDQMTAEQIRQTKAMVDDAEKSGFVYDTQEEYDSFLEGVASAAEEAGTSLGDYYKQVFGSYATKDNIEDFVKDGIIAGAYYDKLLRDYAPSAEEIKSYYDENALDYDKVDYRSFMFTTGLDAEASEEDVTKAMEENKAKADAMLKAYQEDGDFEALCVENATEDMKETYEDPETEYSLAEGRYRSSLSTVMADWLYDDGRTAGDMAVLEDTDNSRYYVVEFIDRYYDEADDENISNTLSSQSVSEYLTALTENCQITDPKGHLKYLTIDTTEETSEN